MWHHGMAWQWSWGVIRCWSARSTIWAPSPSPVLLTQTQISPSLYQRKITDENEKLKTGMWHGITTMLRMQGGRGEIPPAHGPHRPTNTLLTHRPCHFFVLPYNYSPFISLIICGKICVFLLSRKYLPERKKVRVGPGNSLDFSLSLTLLVTIVPKQLGELWILEWVLRW